MATVTMDLIKQLREKTQVGLMDCRKALEETSGDIEKAIDLLRKKGVSVAAKRADMATNEGIIEAFISPQMDRGVLLEIACETDFAANTDAMRKFAQDMAKNSCEKDIEENNIENLMTHLSDTHPGLTIRQVFEELTAKISENIKFGRFAKFAVSHNGIVQSYIHPGSHLGVLLMVETDKKAEAAMPALVQLTKDICMQIAVTNPLAIESTSLDQKYIDREKEIYREQLLASGKPAQMIDKIVEGKLSKYYEDVCLLNQKFIKNDKTTIQQIITEFNRAHAMNMRITRFVRFAIGK